MIPHLPAWSHEYIRNQLTQKLSLKPETFEKFFRQTGSRIGAQEESISNSKSVENRFLSHDEDGYAIIDHRTRTDYRETVAAGDKQMRESE